MVGVEGCPGEDGVDRRAQVSPGDWDAAVGTAFVKLTAVDEFAAVAEEEEVGGASRRVGLSDLLGLVMAIREAIAMLLGRRLELVGRVVGIIPPRRWR